MTWLLLALAGAVGTLCRVGIGKLIGPPAEGAFPYATLVVNLSGCLFFGLVWALAEERGVLSAETRLILLAGFAGAFTTFSTLAFDFVQLARHDAVGAGVVYLLASNAGGMGLVFAGMRVGRWVVG